MNKDYFSLLSSHWKILKFYQFLGISYLHCISKDTIFNICILGLEVAKQDLESEKRKNIALMEQLKDRDRRLKELSNDLENTKNFRAKSSSPAFSIGK